MTLPTEFLIHVARLLERLGIPCHVGGSVAGPAHGMFRASADIDFVIDPTSEQLEALAQALEPEFYSVWQIVGSEPGQAVLFKSPEDTVLRKLEWFRRGGEVSEHQWRDAVSVLAAARGRLDEAYLEHWSGELGIADLLDRARRAAADL